MSDDVKHAQLELIELIIQAIDSKLNDVARVGDVSIEYLAGMIDISTMLDEYKTNILNEEVNHDSTNSQESRKDIQKT